VRHDAERYISGSPQSGVDLTAHVTCDLGDSRADVFASKVGATLTEGGKPLEPESRPSRTLDLAGRRVSIWEGAQAPTGRAWVARWLCPTRERVYLVTAQAGAGRPEEALGRLDCEH
jgi:hypothetical protein